MKITSVVLLTAKQASLPHKLFLLCFALSGYGVGVACCGPCLVLGVAVGNCENSVLSLFLYGACFLQCIDVL